MEKKIEFNEIIAFIEKAMNNNCNIDCSCYDIKVSSNNKVIDFIQGSDHGTDILTFRTSDNGHLGYIYPTEEEILQWKLLTIKCREYQHDKAVNYFNNFFKNNSEFTDINDLDNDDE